MCKSHHCEAILTVFSTCLFLLTSDAKHFFHLPMGCMHVFFDGVSVYFVSHYLKWLIFLLVKFYKLLYTFHIKPLSLKWGKYFLSFYGVPFCSSDYFFTVKQLNLISLLQFAWPTVLNHWRCLNWKKMWLLGQRNLHSLLVEMTTCSIFSESKNWHLSNDWESMFHMT